MGFPEIRSIITRPDQEHQFPNDGMSCNIVNANNKFDLIMKGFLFDQNRAFTSIEGEIITN
jgi:hypothetical protein